MMNAALLVLATFWTLAAASASASDPDESSSPQTIIETRQAGFKKMGGAMKAIVEQLKSAAPDNAKMVTASQVIRSGAEHQLRWFPAGSGPDSGVDTDALPHIWKDRAKFDSIGNQLIPEANKLAVLISANDLAAVKVQVKVVSDTCSTCHRSFRAD